MYICPCHSLTSSQLTLPLLFFITDLIEQNLLWAPLLSNNAAYSNWNKSLVQILKERKTELNSTPSSICNINYIMLLLCSKNLGWLFSVLHTGWSQPSPPALCSPLLSPTHRVLQTSWTACQSLNISFFFFWLFYGSVPSVEGVFPLSLLLVKLLHFHLN